MPLPDKSHPVIRATRHKGKKGRGIIRVGKMTGGELSVRGIVRDSMNTCVNVGRSMYWFNHQGESLSLPTLIETSVAKMM